jgi:hypothetical protein
VADQMPMARVQVTFLSTDDGFVKRHTRSKMMKPRPFFPCNLQICASGCGHAVSDDPQGI